MPFREALSRPLINEPLSFLMTSPVKNNHDVADSSFPLAEDKEAALQQESAINDLCSQMMHSANEVMVALPYIT
jgi:hypothetical protein